MYRPEGAYCGKCYMVYTENKHKTIRIAHWGMTAGRGGLESFVMNIYRRIDRNRVQFDFLEPSWLPRMQYEDEIESLGGRVFRIMESQVRHPLKARRLLCDYFKQHQEVVGMHVHANQPYAYPLKIAKECGIGIRIIHSHNSRLIDDSHGNVLKKIMMFTRDKAVRRQIAEYPTAYFACSDLAAKYMFPGKPYMFIPNGIDTQQFMYNDSIRSRVRKELGIGDSAQVIGFCGWFIERKNPLFALEVFAEYLTLNPNALLMMIGIGELEDVVDAKIDELGIRGRVMLLGSRADINELYQAMDAFVLPSLFEGLGIVYIESQCAGLPTLASLGAVPEEACVNKRLFRFVSLNDSARQWALALQEQIEKAGSRRDGSLEIRAAGFDAADVAEKMMKYYESSYGANLRSER